MPVTEKYRASNQTEDHLGARAGGSAVPARVRVAEPITRDHLTIRESGDDSELPRGRHWQRTPATLPEVVTISRTLAIPSGPQPLSHTA